MARLHSIEKNFSLFCFSSLLVLWTSQGDVISVLIPILASINLISIFNFGFDSISISIRLRIEWNRNRNRIEIEWSDDYAVHNLAEF